MDISLEFFLDDFSLIWSRQESDIPLFIASRLYYRPAVTRIVFIIFDVYLNENIKMFHTYKKVQ